MAVYTLFGQQATGSTVTADTSNYTLGIEFHVTQPGCTLTGIWWYSATGAALPATIALYTVTGTTLVTSNAATWSGAAGSGWVRAAFTAHPALTSGTNYKACVFRGAGSNWYSDTPNYWTSGAGSAGKTSGPIVAPNSAGASPSQDSFVLAAALAYPASASGNATNYWVDPEITTPAAAGQPGPVQAKLPSRQLNFAGASQGFPGRVTTELAAGTGAISGPVRMSGGMGASGAPVSNPTSGPVFRQATRPIRAALIPLSAQSEAGGSPGQVTSRTAPAGYVSAARAGTAGGFSSRQVSSSWGAPVANPGPGPVFKPKPYPVKSAAPAVLKAQTLMVGGVTARGPPAAGYAAFYALRQVFATGAVPASVPGVPLNTRMIRGRIIRGAPIAGSITSRTGRFSGNVGSPVSGAGFGNAQGASGAPVSNPTSGPVFRQAVQAIRARICSPYPGAASAGKILTEQPAGSGNLGGAIQGAGYGSGAGLCGAAFQSTAGAALHPAAQPARARILPPRPGYCHGSPGAPRATISAGPAFRQLPWPVQAQDPLAQRNGSASGPRGRVYGGTSAGILSRNPVTRARARQQGGAAATLWAQRSRAGSSASSLVQNPVAGPVLYPLPGPVRARIPQRAPGGRAWWSATAPPPPPPVIAPFYPAVQAVRARLPQQPARTGRAASSPGAPLGNPHVIAVSGAVPWAIQAALPPHLRGVTRSGTGAPPGNPLNTPGISSGQPAGLRVVSLYGGRARSTPGRAALGNPSIGPVFRQAAQSARAKLPQKQIPAPGTPGGVFSRSRPAPAGTFSQAASYSTGRVSASYGNPVNNAVLTSGPPFQRQRMGGAPALWAGRSRAGPGASGPVSNPISGPVFQQATQPANVRQPLPPRGRTTSNPGTFTLVTAGAPFYPATRPARARIPQNAPRGRTGSNRGTVSNNPVSGTPFRPAVQAIRARQPLPARGRVSFTPLKVPGPAALFRPAVQAVRARLPVPLLTGRTYRTPVAPYPATGPVFRQAVQPVRARWPLPPKGRTSGSAGAPVRTVTSGPRFIQAAHPIRAAIPQNGPRGRATANPGGLVQNVPVDRIIISAGTPFTLWETSGPVTLWDTGTPYTGM